MDGAALEACHVLDTDPRQGREFTTAQARDATASASRKADLLGGYFCPAGGEEGSEGIVSGGHPIDATTVRTILGRPASTRHKRAFLTRFVGCCVVIKPLRGGALRIERRTHHD